MILLPDILTLFYQNNVGSCTYKIYNFFLFLHQFEIALPNFEPYFVYKVIVIYEKKIVRSRPRFGKIFEITRNFFTVKEQNIF